MEDNRHILAKIMGCHGIPERCFTIKGKRMPICARCTGLIIGYFVFIPTPFILKPSFWYFPIGLALSIPLIIDGLTQFKGWRKSNNILRLITGIVSGVGQMMIVFLMSALLMKVTLVPILMSFGVKVPLEYLP